jgi:hypothetical protein
MLSVLQLRKLTPGICKMLAVIASTFKKQLKVRLECKLLMCMVNLKNA